MVKIKKIFLLLLILGGIFLFTQNIYAAELVNINTAGLEELDSLPGIGPSKAQAIIDYRELNGLFEKIEDIMNVSGIGQTTYDNMKDFITLDEVETTTESSEPPPATTYTETVETEPEVLGYEVGSIVVNEFLSDAFDNQVEFVELYNNSEYDIDLTDWWVEEGSGRKSILGGTILANGFFVLEKPKGNLNNAGDIIKLYDPAGGLIDQVSYGNWDDGNTKNNAPKADDPFSVARVYDGQDSDDDGVDFAVTQQITKGSSNIIYTEPEEIISDQAIQSFVSSTSSTTTAKNAVKEKEIPKVEDIKVEITELLPNPTGSDTTEMIELYNPTDEDVDLFGLKLDDEEGGSTPYKFPEGTIIKGGEYMVFGKWDTKLALNNDIDSARLLASDNSVIDEIDYMSVVEGASFSKNDSGEWAWTTKITPGAKNIFSAPVVASTGTATKYTPVIETNLAELREKSMGSRVKIKGIVTVLPGVFGSQYFYISNKDGGVQIYMYSKDFPDLQIGDEIEVTGEISEAYNETRVKIKNKEDIVILGKAEPEPIPISIGEIGEMYEGALLQIKGEITEKKSSYIYLDDGTEELKVYFKENAGIDTKNFEVGDELSIRGVLIERSAGYQLLPRSNDDIDFLSIVSSTENVISSEDGKKDTAEKYLTATAGGLTSILIGLFIKSRGFFVGRFFRKLGAVVFTFVKRG